MIKDDVGSTLTPAQQLKSNHEKLMKLNREPKNLDELKELERQRQSLMKSQLETISGRGKRAREEIKKDMLKNIIKRLVLFIALAVAAGFLIFWSKA